MNTIVLLSVLLYEVLQAPSKFRQCAWEEEIRVLNSTNISLSGSFRRQRKQLMAVVKIALSEKGNKAAIKGTGENEGNRSS